LRSRGDWTVSEEIESFRVEVLDQTLRERIRAETEPIRTMILAQAFSRTGVVDPQDLD
jgi:His-Xaa-Ser system protein HxsD